jgi:hypothetical protein
MIENISSVPVIAFWIAQAISAVLLVAAFTLVGRRYWKIGILAAVVGLAIGFARGVPTHNSSVDFFAFTSIAMLAFSAGVLEQLGSLRREYAKDPSKELGQLMSTPQQKHFTLVVAATAIVLFAGMAICFDGFISVKPK